MSQSARDAYGEAHAEALALLARLQQQIEDVPAPDSNKINWGHVGSMNRVASVLRELIDFVEA